MGPRASRISFTSAHVGTRYGGHHRRQPRERIDYKLDAEGLYRKRVPRDGSSLFRVVAEQVFHVQGHHSKVRAACVRFLERHREEYQHRVEEDFEQYLGRMKDEKTVGTKFEMEVMAALYRKVFCIYYGNRDKDSREIIYADEDIYSEDYGQVMLCHGGGDHYDSVLSKEELTNAGIAQAVVYEVLYGRLFGMGEAIHSYSVLMLHPEAVSALGSEEKGEISRDAVVAVEEGAVVAASQRPLVDPAVQSQYEEEGPPFPYKIVKSFQPHIYRNVAFDIWLEEVKEHNRQNMGMAGRIVNVRVSSDPSADASVEVISYGYIQKVLEDDKRYEVYLTGKDVSEPRKREVPASSIVDFPPVPAKPVYGRQRDYTGYGEERNGRPRHQQQQSPNLRGDGGTQRPRRYNNRPAPLDIRGAQIAQFTSITSPAGRDASFRFASVRRGNSSPFQTAVAGGVSALPGGGAASGQAALLPFPPQQASFVPINQRSTSTAGSNHPPPPHAYDMPGPSGVPIMMPYPAGHNGEGVYGGQAVPYFYQQAGLAPPPPMQYVRYQQQPLQPYHHQPIPQETRYSFDLADPALNGWSYFPYYYNLGWYHAQQQLTLNPYAASAVPMYPSFYPMGMPPTDFSNHNNSRIPVAGGSDKPYSVGEPSIFSDFSVKAREMDEPSATVINHQHQWNHGEELQLHQGMDGHSSSDSSNASLQVAPSSSSTASSSPSLPSQPVSSARATSSHSQQSSGNNQRCLTVKLSESQDVRNRNISSVSVTSLKDSVVFESSSRSQPTAPPVINSNDAVVPPFAHHHGEVRYYGQLNGGDGDTVRPPALPQYSPSKQNSANQNQRSSASFQSVRQPFHANPRYA
ncbi:putative bifunctional UDP-N-acetylglucosamine transferase and deubiquitinase ALG13 [Hypsibius exemplaris]|uniref:Bifunctional UDP-N-acetylglucosamine transferase and deubiquitinase ALG13 n=1 Tax=Hypsibius exemplaris TaxID=2072580 RepID=A0A1W0WZZ3_HYPEX|nr:putative bifunctional UDP-N-acetylglucosamine transferase and deubiquitinase ALG13 [Hypsibius exemplaris]